MSKKSKWTHGVIRIGVTNWSGDALYNRYTTCCSVIKIFESKEEAEEWIAAEEARQARDIPIRPGQGSHTIYDVVSLDKDDTYVTRQDAARTSVNVPMRKLQLITQLAEKV